MVQKILEQTACFSLLASLFTNNIHYFQQHPLFPDNVHYFPTTSTIFRQGSLCPCMLHFLPTKRQHIYRHVPNASTLATLLNISFSLSGPPPHPHFQQTFRALPLSSSPAASPGPWILPALTPCHNLNGTLFPDKRFIIFLQRPLFPDMVYYFQTKGSFFPDNIHYFPTWHTISRQKVHYFQTTSIISQHGILFPDKK
jgi:hypothetical protein